MLRVGAVAVLLVSIGLTSGQETGIGLGTCTYSFVVQSPYCGKDVGNDAEADIIQLQGSVDNQKDTINTLKSQLRALTREMSLLKRQQQSSESGAVSTTPVGGSLMAGHTYVFLGCPSDININIVYFVTTLIEPTHTLVMSFNQSALVDGNYTLLKSILPPFPVFCTIDKFIVIQRRRAPFNLQFNRTWDDYKNGFGDVSGEFWLGLEKLYRITNQPYMRYVIRFEMKMTAGTLQYYESNNFYIASEKERYKILSIGSATAKSVSYYISIGNLFATKDKDVSRNCGASYGGFWYRSSSCTSYAYVLFNRNKPSWSHVSGTPEYTEIKIRPINV